MSLLRALRRSKRALAGAALGCALASAAAQPAPQVADPHYGDALFQFFQERYFTSVTTLMVSQHFARLPWHEDDAEVLRGGLLLSYGLHREAGQIFAGLIERGAKPAVRDRAWYYLAKIRYQRGFVAEGLDAIARIEGKLPGALDEDRALLHANLLLARGDAPAAAAVLQRIAPTSAAAPYARYNLGVALVRGGDGGAGRALLDELGRAPAANEELRSLRDKANVALGFAALKDEQPEQARVALERVRLDSPQAPKALLGFGWAAAALKQPKAALVPWTELAGRDATDAAVLEASIALPYAYAELGAYGQALARYQDAIGAYEREQRALDESIAAVRRGTLVDALAAMNPGEEMGWFWNLRELPEMPHASHLAPVLAGHAFQEAFKNYRDLLFLAGNLKGWHDSLGVFGDMVDTRQRAFAERLPEFLSRSRELPMSPLKARRDALAARLQQAEAAADGQAFADAREQTLIERLNNVQAALKQAGDDPEAAAARERARRVAGALEWQLAQRHAERLWTARKALAATDTALAEAREREAALVKAQRDEPARIAAFAQRIPPLAQRITALIPRVDSLAAEQKREVQELAVAELQRQKERLNGYTVQARYAIAQLQDRARLAQAPGGADAAR